MGQQITILGSGMAGCLAGVFNSGARILEVQKEPHFAHKALLRFKAPAISELTGIPMERVVARKFIWDSAKRDFAPPNPMLANAYSIKVTGSVGDRSVWNVGNEERYIPPHNFHEQLIDACGERIEFGVDARDPHTELHTPIISTIPMNITADLLGLDIKVGFEHKPIYVKTYGIKGKGYQTIYYPNAPGIYRASLTGSELIIESVEESLGGDELIDVFISFGFGGADLVSDNKVHKQSLGKIAPIDEQTRRKFIVDATAKGVYSLGRFATWRNIGLDDVIHDLAVIRRLINADHYEVRKELL